MKNSIYFFSLIVFVFFIHCNKKQEKLFHINLENKESSFISIKTKSKKTEFLINVNDEFPLTNLIILNKIKSLAKEIDKPNYYAAWLWVCKNTKHSKPIISENWIHNPEIFLNSPGMGFCDDRASVLAFIWRDLGYNSRVWNLGGHVVPEVYYNNLWHLLDPDFELYFKSKNNIIASVDKLSKSSKMTPNSNFNIFFSSSTDDLSENKDYKTKVLAFYQTKFNNDFSDWFINGTVNEAYTFKLPKYAKLEFPLPVSIDNSFLVQETFCAKMTLYPNKETQEIQIPLFLFKIVGKAKSNIENNLLPTYNHHLKVENIDDSLELYYYINPNLEILKNGKNKIQFIGKNIEEIYIESNIYNNKQLSVFNDYKRNNNPLFYKKLFENNFVFTKDSFQTFYSRYLELTENNDSIIHLKKENLDLQIELLNKKLGFNFFENSVLKTKIENRKFLLIITFNAFSFNRIDTLATVIQEELERATNRKTHIN